MNLLREYWMFIVCLFASVLDIRVSSLNLPAWDAKNWTGPPAIDPFSPSWPNTVAMCGLMKEEHFDDIEEWLAYHKAIGVDHVYLFEDSPVISEALQAHLQPWIDVGFLELTALDKQEKPYTEVQVQVYRRCSKPDMAGAYSWVMNTDLDEFLIILEDGKASRNPKLKEVLTAFRNNAGIVLQNIMFGSSGHDKRPTPGGPLRHYINCNSYVGPMFKNLANTYWLFGMAIHNAVYRYDDDPLTAPIVRASGAPIIVEALDEKANKTELDFMAGDRKAGERARWHNWMITNETHTGAVTPAVRMVLFHYGTRSKEDYFQRKLRITRDEAKRVGSPFATSLFGGDKDPEAVDDKWFEELQKRDYPNDFGICREAFEANYADAAHEVAMHVRAMSQPLMELQAPSLSRRLQMPRE